MLTPQDELTPGKVYRLNGEPWVYMGEHYFGRHLNEGQIDEAIEFFFEEGEPRVITTPDEIHAQGIIRKTYEDGRNDIGWERKRFLAAAENLYSCIEEYENFLSEEPK